jgi:hypothetical protein
VAKGIKTEHFLSNGRQADCIPDYDCFMFKCMNNDAGDNYICGNRVGL